MEEAVRICARLLREGAVPRVEVPALDSSDVRSEVERRLGEVGLVLATSAYSEHVGIRLSPDVTGDAAFDAASNLGLHADACALLVVLWARLVLQKRTATDNRDVPGQASLLPEDRAMASRRFTPQVRIETLVREFGPSLGSRTHIKGLVSRLRRLRFLDGQGETIEAGPLLELGIDGERMIAFIRRGVLASLLDHRAEPASPAEGEDGGLESQVLRVIERLGGSVGIRDLERATGERRGRLREILRVLVAAGRVRREGERGRTRYHLSSG